MRFDGHLTFPGSAGPVGIKDATLKTQQGDLAGSGSVDFGAQMTIAGKWRSEKLDLDALLLAFGIDLSMPAAPRSSGGPVIPSTRLPWVELRGPTLDIAATVSSLTFQREVWRDFQLGVELRGRPAACPPFKLAGAARPGNAGGRRVGGRTGELVDPGAVAPARVGGALCRTAGAVLGHGTARGGAAGERQTLRDLAGSFAGGPADGGER